jgi:hypothetical protein
MHYIKAFNTVKHARNQTYQKHQNTRIINPYDRSDTPLQGSSGLYSDRINTEALYSWDF